LTSPPFLADLHFTCSLACARVHGLLILLLCIFFFFFALCVVASPSAPAGLLAGSGGRSATSIRPLPICASTVSLSLWLLLFRVASVHGSFVRCPYTYYHPHLHVSHCSLSTPCSTTPSHRLRWVLAVCHIPPPPFVIGLSGLDLQSSVSALAFRSPCRLSTALWCRASPSTLRPHTPTVILGPQRPSSTGVLSTCLDLWFHVVIFFISSIFISLHLCFLSAIDCVP